MQGLHEVFVFVVNVLLVLVVLTVRLSDECVLVLLIFETLKLSQMLRLANLAPTVT